MAKEIYLRPNIAWTTKMWMVIQLILHILAHSMVHNVLDCNQKWWLYGKACYEKVSKNNICTMEKELEINYWYLHKKSDT